MKTILCIADGSPASKARLDYALSFSAAFDAHPVALALAVEATFLYASGVEASPELIAQQIESARAAARDVAAQAEEQIRLTGRPGEVRKLPAPLSTMAEAVARHARYADLTVVGYGVEGAAKDILEEAFDGALFESGRPVLVTPETPPEAARFERIIVAWDGSKQAARAVADAMPLLKRADAIAVAVVDPTVSDAAHGQEPGADVALFLSRHGLQVEVHQLPKSGHSVSEALSLNAKDFNADLIVMGGFGRSHWREFLFGGVSRSLLGRQDIPLFMAH